MPSVRPNLPFPAYDPSRAQAVSGAPAEFLAQLKSFQLELDGAALEALSGYVQLLLASSKLLNLTALRDSADVWMKLVFDSLTLLPALQGLPAGARGVDVGSGGGVPGIPLAIVAPELHFTLIDATAKKVAFLEHVIRELGLGNAHALVGRAEALASTQGDARQREAFDFVVARAVAPLPVLLELTAPFGKAPGASLASGAKLLLIKGERASDELAAAARAMRLLGVAHTSTQSFSGGRILVFDKLSATPARYPRANGSPKRNPL